MTKEETTTQEEAYRQDLRGGVWILFLLAVFTIGEFVVALVSPTIGWILIIAALPKAYFVITDYMHIGHLFGESEEDH